MTQLIGRGPCYSSARVHLPRLLIVMGSIVCVSLVSASWSMAVRGSVHSKPMGLCADLVAWGPYSPEIARYLEYGPNAYGSTLPGALVVTELFGIVEGTHAGKQFAACLGISDVWDFNQHHIDPQSIDMGRLRLLLQGLGDWDRYATQLEALLVLRTAGFQFVFRPNG